MRYCNLQTALNFLRQAQKEVERIQLVKLRDEVVQSNGFGRIPKSTPNQIDFDDYHLKDIIDSIENASKSLEKAIGVELALRFKHEAKSRSISKWLKDC